LHGTLNLAHAVLADAPGCFLLYVSSADAYGTSFAAGQPVDETQPLAPMNLYGATKAAADLALGAMVADGLHVVRVRPTNHIGPGQAADFVVGAFAEQAVRIAAGKQPPTMRVGNLDAQRDFLDVRDVCSAYVACLQQAEALVPGTILNVASGIPRSIRDVLESLLTAAGIRPRIELDPARIRAADIPIAIGDARRARTLLGWAPTVPWEQTIADVLAVWRDRIAG
jgi:GDP-4-dehydro-6-deoxy-D-mannose reductase